jgi:hypothetical protein
MLGTDLGYRHRLAALVGLCLIVALSVVPAAVAVPILEEGEEYVPALAPNPGGFAPPLAVQTSSTGVDWSNVVLVAVVGLAAAIAATALIRTTRHRRPVPAPHV